MTEIHFIWGTRPEIIKIAPVMVELARLGIQSVSVCSGQHTDLLDGLPTEEQLVDTYSLNLGTSDVPRLYGPIRKAIENLKPTIVVVQGDTNTAFAAATAAADNRKKRGWPFLAHLEAGIRSGDLKDPWPEERNRRKIDKLADFHYAPTKHCVHNLVDEGIDKTDILVTGNTVVSALHRYSPPVGILDPRNVIMVTLHRSEIQNPVDTKRLYDLIKREATRYTFENLVFDWPMHPGFKKHLGRVHAPDLHPRVRILRPLDYTRFTTNLMWSKGIITDSGGVVEEAATLGVPVAILRRTNDRPEAEEAGIAKLFPPDDPECVSNALEWLLKAKRGPQRVFGGPESARIVALDLARKLKGTN